MEKIYSRERVTITKQQQQQNKTGVIRKAKSITWDKEGVTIKEVFISCCMWQF